MFNEDDRFDLKIRSVLENGREEVPDHIWDAIRSRLDSPVPDSIQKKGSRHVVVLLRRAGAGMAAAAAVSAALVFSGLFDRNNSPETQYSSPIAVVEQQEMPADSSAAGVNDILIAQVLPEEAVPADNAATVIPSSIHVTGIKETAAVTGEADTADGTETTETAKEPAGQQEDPASGSSSQATEPEKSVETGQDDIQEDGGWDDFEETPEQGKKRKIRTSLTISGNAISNANAENSKNTYMMAPGSGSTGIREIGEGNSRFGIPVSVGAGVRLGFTPKWSMSIGLNYSFLTRTFDGIYTEEGKSPVEYSDIRNSQHYIGIPVNVYYNIIRKNFVDLYAYAGGAADYCVSNKYTAENDGKPLYYNGSVGSVQFSANIGIGVEFILTDHLGLYIDPSLRYYFRNSKAPKSIRTVQPLMLGFEAGFRILL